MKPIYINEETRQNSKICSFCKICPYITSDSTLNKSKNFQFSTDMYELSNSYGWKCCNCNSCLTELEKSLHDWCIPKDIIYKTLRKNKNSYVKIINTANNHLSLYWKICSHAYKIRTPNNYKVDKNIDDDLFEDKFYDFEDKWYINVKKHNRVEAVDLLTFIQLNK